MERHAQAEERAALRKPNRPLWDLLADALDDDDDSDQCAVCAL